MALAVLLKLVITPVFKPAGDSSWLRQHSFWYLVTMVQVRCTFIQASKAPEHDSCMCQGFIVCVGTTLRTSCS